MNKKQQQILLFFLFFFSVYCALIIGKSWDEGFHLKQGKSSLEYFFSLGSTNEYFWGREYYSALYWTLQYFLTTIFPKAYQIQASHIVNLIFSLATIFGIGKLGKELFNKQVGKIIFLILFFYPIFFGHMGMNPKDTILAFSHVWITYYVLKYLRTQHLKIKSAFNKYIIYISTLAALATGIQIFFLGSLIPIFIFILLEVFIFKKIIHNNFNKKVFFYDLLKSLFIFYFLLIIFWIDTHPNIFVLPYKIFMSALSNSYMTGWPFNLVNGTYYLSWQPPKLYFLTNMLFKSPEYFLISYVFFLLLVVNLKLFFEKIFLNYSYKLYLVLLMIIFPNLVSILIPFPLYDGMRLFLWSLPYFCIIPGLTIYYLIKNFNDIKSKLFLSFLSLSVIYFLFNFFIITPYQYTYLNILNGENSQRYKKFESDYWSVSINELIKKINLDKNDVIKVAVCGAHPRAYTYLKKAGYKNIKKTNPKEADYIIMTNRTFRVSGELTTQSTNKNVKILNCFDRFKGEDIFKVERNNTPLSVFRKKTSINIWD